MKIRIYMQFLKRFLMILVSIKSLSLGYMFPLNAYDNSLDIAPLIMLHDQLYGVDHTNEIMLRGLNDSYIKLNANNNVDIRMTGSATFLGVVNLPSTAKKSVNGSLIAIDAAGNLGITSSPTNTSYTFSSDIFVDKSATLYVSEIDPRSPTTTTSFSGSISLPSTTTANNGSLQINGTPFLHNFGTNNTFVGANAGNRKMSGTGNTAIGSGSLSANTSGASNITIGVNAGNTLTTGSNNIDIGNVGVAAESNTIRIGTSGTQTQCFVAGISGVTVVGNAVSVNGSGQLGVVLSSRKYKDDIKDIGSISKEIMALRPVTFVYKDYPDHRECGLIAEEVELVDKNLVLYKDGQPESVRYQVLPVMLLNEHQLMRKELDTLKARLEKLERANETD